MESIELKGKSEKVKGLFQWNAFLSPFRGLGLLLLLLTASATQSNAQTFDEWFNQNATQIKYLGLQIAALAQFELDLKHGYSVAKAGLTSIGNFTGTEFGLHGVYLSSLRAVNPVVAGNADIALIRSDMQEIGNVFNALPFLSGLTVAEQHYVAAVKSEMWAANGRDGDELALIVTPGKLAMTDDERLRRLGKLYGTVQDRLVFARSFCTRVALLVGQRQQNQSAFKTLNQLYGID